MADSDNRAKPSRQSRIAMDAREYFQRIVMPDYAHFQHSPKDVRLLSNALVARNAVAKFLGLHRLGYALDISREELDEEVETIHVDLRLTALHFCANMFKHVRRITVA